MFGKTMGVLELRVVKLVIQRGLRRGRGGSLLIVELTFDAHQPHEGVDRADAVQIEIA